MLYRVRPGKTLSHEDVVYREGTVLELSDKIGQDSAVRESVEKFSEMESPVRLERAKKAVAETQALLAKLQGEVKDAEAAEKARLDAEAKATADEAKAPKEEKK